MYFYNIIIVPKREAVQVAALQYFTINFHAKTT